MIILLFIAAFFLAACTTQTPVSSGNTENNVPVAPVEQSSVEDVNPPEILISAEEKVQNGALAAGYSGKALAGDNAFYIEYNQVDYDAAVADNKLIVLVFYTSDYETSKNEDVQARAAFYELDDDTVVGFRVNYLDADVDNDENKAAAKFGVIDKNTKVIVKNGKVVFKNFDSWDKEKYINEITRN